MSERKINLEKIIKSCISPEKSTYNNICKDAMLEFGKQLLELAAENSKIEIKTVGEELIITDIYQEDNYTRMQVNIQSILDTVKQIE